jgi:hypothetical protein
MKKTTANRKHGSLIPNTARAQDAIITGLSVRRFKGFDHLEIEQISRVTLLGGRNNVGKTSVLEALMMFHDSLNPQMILRQFAMRGVGIIPFEPQSMWAPVFFDYNLEQQVEIAIVINDEKEILKFSYNPDFEAPTITARDAPPGFIATQIRTDQKPVPSYSLDITYESKSNSYVSHLLMGLGYLELRTEKTRFHLRPVTFITARTPVNPAEDARRFGQLDIIGKQNSIVNFLTIIEPRLKSLSSVTIGDTSLIHGDIGLSRKIPVSYMGDGMARLLSIILAIATTQNGVVLIDECENGLHHSIMPKIWHAIGQAAREYNCQVICTTHSYECVAAAEEGMAGDLTKDFCYVRIDRDDKTFTARRFDHEMLAIALKNNMEVR